MSYLLPFISAAVAKSSFAPSSAGGELRTLPKDTLFLRILGVNYVHVKTADDGDLYVTEHGLPFIEHLKPDSWYETTWFEQKRERLAGTSTVYKVPTKPLDGKPVRSMDLVVKWSRVGQDVPLDTFTLAKVVDAEFNTPFEEFSLVEELREGTYGPPSLHILMQKPLAIYVPPERMQLWQTGRSKSKIRSKIARHPGVAIDILRSYILLYAWVKGVNAVEAYQATAADGAEQQKALGALTQRVSADLERKGFMVADNKPTHFILRLGSDRRIQRRRDGEILYGLIDYELLARTPAHEDAVKASNRSSYLVRQRDRFKPRAPSLFPTHLDACQVMGVDYVYGRTESTNGALWVVGRDPELFTYFLPERWRTKQIKLSHTNQTFYTQTKDRIHLVWKVSRVGELPPGDFDQPDYEMRLLQGFNSPFEEFSLALALAAKGVRTTYPRAIYMTGQETELAGCIVDERRFDQSRSMLTPDGSPILRIDRDYVTIWGYWRGLEDTEASSEKGYYIPIDALQASRIGLVSPKDLEQLIERHRQTLLSAGFVDSNLTGEHILLSYIPEGTLKKDKAGQIETRQCNFELVKRM